MRNFFWLLFLIPIFLFSDEQILDLGSFGSVRYIYQDGRLFQVDRLSISNEVVYSHFYRYNDEGILLSEKLIGDLGEIVYEDFSVISPYSREEISYDQNSRLIHYHFEDMSYEYRVGIGNELITGNRREFAIYDAFGRVVQIKDRCFEYDDNDQLITVISPSFLVRYGYNNEGLRISRTVNGETEYFIHLGINEYARTNDKGFVSEIRIPGLSIHKDILHPIAIETEGTIYAPIHDLRGNIVKLVDMNTRKIISLAQPDPFGHGLDRKAPTNWIFANKHYDPVTNLVYFGSRYYSPDLEEWLTPDPLAQTANLYEYCFNNPFFYVDPDGKYSIAVNVLKLAFGTGAVISSPLWGSGALVLAGAAAAVYAGSEVYKNYQSYQHMEAHKEKEGKQKDGCPKSNGAQNKQFRDAIKEIEKK